MPELRRVIVANGNVVAMEETFERALQMVMADRPPGESPAVPGTQAGAAPAGASPAAPVLSLNELQRLLQQARQSSDTTQAELERLRGLLDQIERAFPRGGP